MAKGGLKGKNLLQNKSSRRLIVIFLTSLLFLLLVSIQDKREREIGYYQGTLDALWYMEELQSFTLGDELDDLLVRIEELEIDIDNNEEKDEKDKKDEKDEKDDKLTDKEDDEQEIIEEEKSSDEDEKNKEVEKQVEKIDPISISYNDLKEMDKKDLTDGAYYSFEAVVHRKISGVIKGGYYANMFVGPPDNQMIIIVPTREMAEYFNSQPSDSSYQFTVRVEETVVINRLIIVDYEKLS